VNVTEVVEHVVKSKHRKFEGKNIELAMDFPVPLLIKGFQGELRQVFENLIDNAIDAVPVNGRINVRGLTEGKSGDNRVVIVIADNGPGIASSQLANLFEPFFTTKADKGSGLGLWVSRSIVQKHGGSIRMTRSQNGAEPETVFTIELPFGATLHPGAPAYTNLAMNSARV
jgi:signal transduction histidine kinase